MAARSSSGSRRGPPSRPAPGVALPSRRASGRVLHVLVDDRERYPWRFAAQQATTERRRLPAGDYAVEAESRVVAAVERKSAEDLAGSLLSRAADLRPRRARRPALPCAAVVVEDRYSRLFALEHVAAGRVAEVRAWARAQGLAVSDRGRIAAEVRAAYDAAH